MCRCCPVQSAHTEYCYIILLMAMDGIRRKSFIALLVVWSVLELNEVHGQDIVIDCQTVRDGVVSTFGGTLNKANISSVCDALVPSKVTFLLTYPTTVTDVLCEQQLSPCNPVENAEGCRCVSDAANAYTFEFNFRFNKSKYEGSTLSLTTDCLSSASNGLTSNDPCDLKEVAPTTPPPDTTSVAPTTTPPDTTSETETPPTSDQGCPICKKGTDCDEPDLLCLLFLLLLIPIAVVIIIVWYFFCHNGGINATKKAEGGELESLPQDQQTTNGNKPANGNGCGQRDNKAGTGHVAPNGAS